MSISSWTSAILLGTTLATACACASANSKRAAPRITRPNGSKRAIALPFTSPIATEHVLAQTQLVRRDVVTRGDDARRITAESDYPAMYVSPDGRTLWRQFEDTYQEIRILRAPARRRVRFVPAVGLDSLGVVDVALVVEGASVALLLDDSGEYEPIPLERAPRNVAARSDITAMTTPRLRYLGACPRSRATCLLFGPEDDVLAARDPTLPEGGWWLAVNAQSPSTSGLSFRRARSDHEELILQTAEREPLDDEDPGASFVRVQLKQGRRRVHSFDVTVPWANAFAEDVYASSGVTRTDREILVWMWLPELVTVYVARHERSTGERLQEPVVFEGRVAEEVDCGHVLMETRPVPVLDGDRLVAALWWGTEEALLFENRGEEGRFVHVVVPANFDSRDPRHPQGTCRLRLDPRMRGT